MCVMLGKGQGKWPQSPGRKKEGIPRAVIRGKRE